MSTRKADHFLFEKIYFEMVGGWIEKVTKTVLKLWTVKINFKNIKI